MQVLGGDPEAAYLTGLCAGGYAVGLAVARWRERQNRLPVESSLVVAGTLLAVLVWFAIVLVCAIEFPRRRPPGPPAGPLPWSRAWPLGVAATWATLGICLFLPRRMRGAPLTIRLGGLALAAGLAGLLCAAQMLPVIEYTGKTTRAAIDGPHDIYPFAVEPYRLVETVWPQVYGASRGGNTTWDVLIPPRHKTSVWVPSLYVGGLTIVLALSVIGLRGLGARRVWLSWIALISLLASMGEYGGPLWYARCVPALAKYLGPHDPPDTTSIRADLKLRDGDGSVYGVMAIILPGFGGFRYPAKLMTFTCMAVAGLAGIGLDGLLAGRSRRALRLALGLAVTGAVLLVFVQARRTEITAWFTARAWLKGNSAYGPFDPSGAWRDTREALLHGTALMASAVLLIVVARRFPRAAAACALLIATVDLVAANSKLVLTVPQSVFDETPEVMRRIAEAEAKDPSPGPFRVHRMPYWDPTGFNLTSSPHRDRELTAWERKTLQPKYGIPLGISYTFTEGVAELYDYAWFFAPFYVERDAQAAALAGKAPTQLIYFPRRGFDLWSARYFIVPAVGANDERRGHFSFLFDVEQIAPTKDRMADKAGSRFDEAWKRDEDWALYKNKHVFPRSWVVHQADFRSPIEGYSKEARRQRQSLVESLVYGGDQLWKSPARQAQDLRSKAFVEVVDQQEVFRALSFRGEDPSETAEIVIDDDPRVVIQAHLESAGMVVLADVFYPGWELYVDGQRAPIYQVNRLMRGALVGAGDHRLVYVYNPRSARLGVAVSTSALVLLAGYLAWCRSRPRSIIVSQQF